MLRSSVASPGSEQTVTSPLVLAREQSKLGRVVTAVRDGETRLMFLGYSPLAYKLFIWTVSAVLCAIAGALYVPQVGIINPGEMSPGNSIEMAIWVAVGGRGTLIGPIIGAFAVNGAKSFFTANFPEYWLFFLGLIFVLVPLLLPNGIMGLIELLTRRSNRQADSMRARIAAAAARIMAEDGVDDFGLAKRKAARTLGAAETQALPGYDQIEAELRAYRALYQAEEHAG